MIHSTEIHTCHAPGCARRVPASMFACKPHWFMLPERIRDAIWKEYRQGQEIHKTPTPRYMAVQRFACAFLAFKPNDEVAAIKTAGLCIQAEMWASRSIEQGLGDPLETLRPLKHESNEPSKKVRGTKKKA